MRVERADPSTYAVSSSILAPAALLADLAAAYIRGVIGMPQQCVLWRRGVTDTYLVRTTAQRYILRVYPTGWRTNDEVAYELDALHHLHTNGVPVALPIRRDDTRWFWTVRAPEGPWQLVLFRYAPGRAAYLEDDYARRWGRAVAAIHAVTDSFHSTHARFELSQTELLDKPVAALAPLLAQRG